MNRRQFLEAGVVGLGPTLVTGCLRRGVQSPSGSTQSGSGHPCDSPRLIDYDAVDRYRDHGVYLENADDAAHTACVTVTKADTEREESAPSSPPPLRQLGYAIDPGVAVEIVTFDESGRYTITVQIEETTQEEVFEITEADFDDQDTTITTFEITSPSSIAVTQRGKSQ